MKAWRASTLALATSCLAFGCAAVNRGLYGTVTVTKVEPARSIVTIPFPPSKLVLSPDGSTLAAGSMYGAIRIWDVATGTERAPLEPLSSLSGIPLCLSLDGRMLAFQKNQAIFLFDVTASRRVGLLTPPDSDRWYARLGPVESAAFSRDGTTVVYVQAPATRRRTSFLWIGELDVATGRNLWREELRVDPSYWPEESDSAKLSPDGGLLAYIPQSHDRVDLWDTTLRRLRATITDLIGVDRPWTVPGGGPGTSPARIAFSSDGRRMALLAHNGVILDTLDGSALSRFSYQWLGSPGPAAFSPDAHILAVGLPGGGVQLFNVASGKMIFAVSDSESPVPKNSSVPSALAFLPDGRQLVVAPPRLSPGEVKLWEVSRLIQTTPGG